MGELHEQYDPGLQRAIANLKSDPSQDPLRERREAAMRCLGRRWVLHRTTTYRGKWSSALTVSMVEKKAAEIAEAALQPRRGAVRAVK